MATPYVFFCFLYILFSMNDEAVKKGILAFGGDVGLGRYMNFMAPTMDEEKILGTLPVFKESDLSIVNLECVVSSLGEAGIDKGENVPYYFRGRPEMLNILTSADVDVVSVANNHSGDYGPEAFKDMLNLLDQSGIDAVGGGLTLSGAKKHIVRWVGDVAVAFIGIDFTQPQFSANDETPGNYYLSPTGAHEWFDELYSVIYQAKLQSHLVFPIVHWGNNLEKEPSENMKSLARAILDAGADGVLGASAHILHGVEIVEGKPVIYDAGNFLIDFRPEKKVAGVFQLKLTQDGVEEIRLIPTQNKYCFTLPATPEIQKHTFKTFSERSKALGTDVQIYKDSAYIYLKPEFKERKNLLVAPENKKKTFVKLGPSKEPPANCIVDAVPEIAIIEAQKFGPVELIGLHTKNTIMKKLGLVEIESYWRLSEEEIDKNFIIVQRFVHEKAQTKEDTWDADHDPCDFMWPMSRWKKGVIYRDRFLVRPRNEHFNSGKYEFLTGVADIKTQEQYIRKLDYPIIVE